MGVHRFEMMPTVMKARAGQVAQGMTRIVKRAHGAVSSAVIRATPVDKGVARSNWVGNLNGPFRGVIPAYSPGHKLGLGETANATAAIGQNKAVALGFLAGKNMAIHTSNSVRYMGKLNAGGHSSQAPVAGFIDLAVQTGVVSVKGMTVLRR